MKKILFIAFILISSFSYGQTVRQLIGLNPTTSMPGYIYRDTSLTAPYSANKYLTGFLTWGTIDSLKGVAYFTKNATRDSFILVRDDSTRFAAKDSSGGGGGTPAGSNNYVQTNQSSAFSADSTFQFNKSGFALSAPPKTFVGGLLKPTISSTANNDTLIGLDLSNTYSIGANTGVKQIGLRVDGVWFHAGKGKKDGNIGIGIETIPAVTGANNVAIGSYTLESLTSGNQNIGIGYRTLQTITTTGDNVGIGFDALRLGIGFAQNVGVGTHALYSTSSGTNTAVGYYAIGLGANSGTYNNAYGAFSMRANTTGSNNTAIGGEALIGNTTGSENISIGTQTLSGNTIGKGNIAIGHQSLLSTASYSNTAVGQYGGFGNTSGHNNIFIGDSSGYASTTASNQIFINSLNRLNNYTNDTTYSVFYAVQDFTGSVGTLQRTKIGGGGTVGINGYGLSTLDVKGSFSTAYVAKTGTYTATIDDNLIECTSGTFTVTLPTAVGITGREYWIVNTGSGTITAGTTSSQTFVNVSGTPTTLTIAQFTNYRVVSNGANWMAFKIVN